MTTIVVVVALAGVAAAAIERSVAVARYKADAAVWRIRAESYKTEAIRIKHDFQRIQAAQESAIEAAQVAIGAGDARRALAALASMQQGGRRLYDQSTSDMLATAAAAAVANAGGNGLSARGGLLGRLARGTDRSLDGAGDDLDETGRGMSNGEE